MTTSKKATKAKTPVVEAPVAKYPNRLDITDMPRDKSNDLGSLRRALCACFNYCRKYPRKMVILKEVIRYVHNRIVEWEKTNAK